MVPDNAPSKASLLKWWSQFTHAQKHRKHDSQPPFSASPPTSSAAVFANPLKDSLRRASVQISTANANGDLYVWGYIPVVVAKWSVSRPPRTALLTPPSGLYLKENGTAHPRLYTTLLTPRSHRDRRYLSCKWLSQTHARATGGIRDTAPRA